MLYFLLFHCTTLLGVSSKSDDASTAFTVTGEKVTVVGLLFFLRITNILLSIIVIVTRAIRTDATTTPMMIPGYILEDCGPHSELDK